MGERLWAGWRMKYIESSKSGECLFCAKSRSRPGKKNLVLAVSEKCLVMLNAFPYNCGHLMVAPKRHVGSMSGLSRSEWSELAEYLSLSERILKKAYGAQGFNVGMNLGRCAGAGVLGHLHVHVVPRWSGDTNFMSTTAATEVLPDTLGSTYAKLRTAMEEVLSPSGGRTTKRRHGSKKA
ncbi:MAG: HIT domain-containing protein [Candidatus Eiseniibacteriota bacterium]|nr:MAG: HIT domain-containing protein [Candidatus Eisenbacteria bacterium]